MRVRCGIVSQTSLPCQDYVAIHRYTPVRWPRHLGPCERRLFGREQTTGANRVLVARRTLRVLTTSRLRSPSPLQSSPPRSPLGPATLRADPVASIMAPLYDIGEFVVVEHQRPIIRHFSWVVHLGFARATRPVPMAWSESCRSSNKTQNNPYRG